MTVRSTPNRYRRQPWATRPQRSRSGIPRPIARVPAIPTQAAINPAARTRRLTRWSIRPSRSPSARRPTSRSGSSPSRSRRRNGPRCSSLCTPRPAHARSRSTSPSVPCRISSPHLPVRGIRSRRPAPVRNHGLDPRRGARWEPPRTPTICFSHTLTLRRATRPPRRRSITAADPPGQPLPGRVRSHRGAESER